MILSYRMQLLQLCNSCYCVNGHALTGLVCRVVVLDEEGVPVVPDLLAGSGVVPGNERLEVGVEDASLCADVDGRLTLSSRNFQRLLPHRVH